MTYFCGSNPHFTAFCTQVVIRLLLLLVHIGKAVESPQLWKNQPNSLGGSLAKIMSGSFYGIKMAYDHQNFMSFIILFLSPFIPYTMGSINQQFKNKILWKLINWTYFRFSKFYIRYACCYVVSMCQPTLNQSIINNTCNCNYFGGGVSLLHAEIFGILAFFLYLLVYIFK